MDATEQTRLREALAATLEDERLSRSESETLDALVATLAEDRAALAFVRNQAFRLAKERVEQQPRSVLAWLDRVDKIVDHALRAPGADRRDTVAFSPGDACLKLVRGHLSSARRTLEICVFTITDDRITEAILAAAQRGVKVRVLTDDDKAFDPGSDVDRLRQAGIDVATDRTPDHMHHKFAIVDGALLLNGSFNWTRSAADNHENVHATTEPAVVRAYAEQFDRLWSQLGPPGRHGGG